MEVTPWKISTVTATGGVNTQVDLEVLLQHAAVGVPFTTAGTPMECGCKSYELCYIEYGKKHEETRSRGELLKKKVRRKKEEKKRFENQATIIIRYILADDAVAVVNMKVFKNGNVQMTGLKTTDFGRCAVDSLIAELRRIAVDHPKVVADPGALANTRYNVGLINCDFTVGMEIKRERLHTILQQRYRGVFVSYEPCIYPAVKVELYWCGDTPNKCCNCEVPCWQRLRPRSRARVARCKKITIAVFQSGCVIITGAQTLQQVTDAYHFICAVLARERLNVRKLPYL